MNASQPSAAPVANPSRWERFSSATASGFRRYAEWLVSISWKKFFLLSLLLLIAAGILAEIPPFSLKFTVGSDSAPESPAKRTERAKKLKEKYGEVDIKIDHQGIHIRRQRSSAPPPAPKASPDMPPTPSALPEQPAIPAPPKSVVEIGRDGVTVTVPPGTAEEIRAAVEEARESIREAIEEEIAADVRKPRLRVIRLGGFLPQLALLLIVVSMVIKIVYAGRVKAEVKAAEAQETADSESLRRQVVEARMAAMQAQVEPHFLFNTLASIDHLIEVDPARASTMQKNLIALLRASMPGMREAETNLGRELAVVRPYLEILRVRMGDRLQTEVNVSAGLHSAEFPPMMLQSLVENAIKHGLEPKPEGGTLRVDAEVVHGRLEISVADTGVGFGRAATAGTGVGLANIRERLKLLYGGDAELRIADHAPSGTRVTVVVPYRIANNTSRA
ncbi:MAG: sensor histidine kinase [Betaproteobacteria bacterium]|nr:MAG: sensor histidine kinase [Betaproteobacteria bacterium]